MIVLYLNVFEDQNEIFYLINLEVVKLFSFDLLVNVDDQLIMIINHELE
jgi:hypothetical protein